MKVMIEERLYVESDTSGYQVVRYGDPATKIDKDGNEVDATSSKILGYMSTLEGCINFIVNLKLKDSTAKDLRELIQHMQEIRAWVQQAVKS